MLTYRIRAVPAVPPVLRFMQQQTAMSDEDAYGTLNMGAGFALFVAAADVATTLDVARQCGVPALLTGVVEAGAKQVLIEPLGITFGGESLQLR